MYLYMYKYIHICMCIAVVICYVQTPSLGVTSMAEGCRYCSLQTVIVTSLYHPVYRNDTCGQRGNSFKCAGI